MRTTDELINTNKRRALPAKPKRDSSLRMLPDSCRLVFIRGFHGKNSASDPLINVQHNFYDSRSQRGVGYNAQRFSPPGREWAGPARRQIHLAHEGKSTMSSQEP